jgi:hypothetical protein
MQPELQAQRDGVAWTFFNEASLAVAIGLADMSSASMVLLGGEPIRDPHDRAMPAIPSRTATAPRMNWAS